MVLTYGGARASINAPSDFSFLRLIEAQRRDGNPAKGQFEAGLVQLMRERGGVEVQSRLGSPLPDRTLLRDLGTTPTSAGGGLVTTGVMAMVEAVRPVMVFEQLGAQVIEIQAPTAQGFTIPFWSGELGADSWIEEGQGAPIFAGLEIAALTLDAHGCAARLAFSRKLASSAGVALEPALVAELGRAVRSELERGFLQGDGTAGQPVGLLAAPGKGSVTFAAATPTAGELASMVEVAGDANADFSRCAWLLHPSDLADMLRTQAAPGGEMVAEWSDGAHRIHGFRVATTTHITEGEVFFGDFSAVRIGYFGPPQLIIDTFSNGKSATGATEVVVINYADIGIVNPSQLVLGSS